MGLAQGLENETRVGKESSGAEKECSRGDVAGNDRFDSLQRLRAGDGDGVDGACECGSKGAEREFAVIACANGLADDRSAFRLQSSEKDAGLDLCAGNWRGRSRWREAERPQSSRARGRR